MLLLRFFVPLRWPGVTKIEQKEPQKRWCALVWLDRRRVPASYEQTIALHTFLLIFSTIQKFSEVVLNTVTTFHSNSRFQPNISY